MAPAIKELSQWLDANVEYFVAPDWADVVKHSVSLANLMFYRIFAGFKVKLDRINNLCCYIFFINSLYFCYSS